jgi:4a-hydroxytetrahydrobiopterin dehydratase
MEDVVTGLFAPGVLRNCPPLSTLLRDFGKGTAMAEKGLSSEAEIRAALAELPGWKQQGNAIVKTYDLKGFKAAMAFAGTVSELAERADHHPDILIQFHKVTLTLTSHDKGGITDRDLRLARQIEAAAKDQMA